MITSFQFTLKAIDQTEVFAVSSERGVEPFIDQFLPLFDGVDLATRRIESLQRNTPELQERIERFVSEHAGEIPQIQRISAFFRRLPASEPFFLLPEVKIEQTGHLSLSNYLRSIKEGRPFEDLEAEQKALFGDLWDKYYLWHFGEHRLAIGEPNKTKRICRFCHKGADETSFDQRAHAISEALGNKTLTLYEECDACNERFNKTIEGDIIEYFSFYRTLYGIKGKGGEKTFKGTNFQFDPGDTLRLAFENGDDKVDFALPYTLVLKANQIAPQNIYKMFCKYFLSVLPSDYLSSFSATIDWLNGPLTTEDLPRVGILPTREIRHQPTIATYIRKVDDKILPFAVGEFSFSHLKHVFVIPFSSKDDRPFSNPSAFGQFWAAFPHFGKVTGWVYQDLSSPAKKDFEINLVITSKDGKQEVPR